MADYVKNACSLYEEQVHLSKQLQRLRGRRFAAGNRLDLQGSVVRYGKPYSHETLMVGPSGQTRHRETPLRPN